MGKDWTTVDLLRHSRHDWLNKIQLLKGNLDMDKLDRVQALLEEIIVEAQHEANLSNLGLPLFSEILLTANWMGHSFRCECEAESIGSEMPALDEQLAAWTEAFLNELDACVDLSSENTLIVSINEPDSGNVCFTFELEGKLKDEGRIEAFLKQPLPKGIKGRLCCAGNRDIVFHIEINS